MRTNDKILVSLANKLSPFTKKVRNITVRPATQVKLDRLNWSDGYKNQYNLVNLVSHENVEFPEPPWNEKPRDRYAKIEEGIALIEFGWRGIGHTITVYVHPNNIVQQLEHAELTDNERLFLECTASYKNSYGGEKNLRWKEANREKKRKQEQPITFNEWEEIKTGLILKKLLTKSGALTNSGRNQVR